MALDIHDIGEDAAPASVTLPSVSGSPSGAARRWLAALSRLYHALSRWHQRQPVPRFVSASLRRRILFTNVLGLAGLLLAMLYISLHHGWLLDAKVDVVKTVSRITSEAIAYRALNERAIFDADRLPDHALPKAQRDDAFAAFELPIDPQQAALVLKKLVGPANLKARIFSQKGTLILDSDTLFSKTPPEAAQPFPGDGQQPRLKNFWTRFHYC